MKNNIKIYFILTGLLFYCNFILFAQNNYYEPNKIVVKFKKNSNLLVKWMHRSRTGEFEEFSQLLGSNTSKGFVSDAILNLISERYNSLMKEKVTPNSYESENVSRICIIEYNSSVDPLVVAGKLKSYPDVEYAEPLYTRKIVGVPNDPLLNKQYCLTQIKVYDAWDSLKTSDTLTIGIVDTGVDYNHEDLSANMFINPGETGLDSAGHDKRFNGIDDDHNGLVDDWRGWDFESSTSPTGQDNDPQPGHEHGTHVAGIIGAVINNHIGIAGVAENVKLLAVKVSQDDPSSGSIYNGYEGVLYAASMGASVINCSWGSPNKSQAEEDMIKQAINMGSVLVAAAGNDAANLPYYPAADENVLSVAAVDSYDIKAGFSNYHNSISVSAPGVEIYSTLPGNQYDALSGTSMSSPIAAGVAALVRLKFPQYTPLQVVEQVKASSDNIDSLNPFYIGTIGKGRVNAFKAVTSSNLKSVILNSYQFTNPDYNDIIDIGDTVEITISLTNVLSPMINGKILTGTISNSPYSLNFINDTSTIGTMNTLETKSALSNIIFSVPGNIPPNYITTIEIKIFDDTTYCNSVYFDLNIHPSYRTMNGNDITVTFNNRGNIGYNDYPKNNQGIGFIYKNYPNILYEGALMVGTSATKLSDVARGPFQNFEDDAFNSNETFVIDTNGKTAKYEGTVHFRDDNLSFDAGVAVSQKVYQFNDSTKRNFIIVNYDIINQSGSNFDSLYAALYFDWDIGPSGNNNQALYDNDNVFGWVMNVKDTSMPLVGVSLLSSDKLNYYAIDNPTVWDGFTNSEKWMMMTSGVYRKQSGITDVSMVIGAGPIRLNANDTAHVAFSIFVGNDIAELKSASRVARETAIINGIANGNNTHLPPKDSILSLYPNPAPGNSSGTTMSLLLALTNGSNITIDIVDVLGNVVHTVIENQYFTAGIVDHPIMIPVSTLSQGRYFLRISTIDGQLLEPFTIIR